MRFHHRVDNTKDSFEFQVKQQGIEAVREQLVNPLENLVWGDALVGDNFALAGATTGTYAGCPFRGWKYVSKAPATSHRLRVCLHIDQIAEQDAWDAVLQDLIDLTPTDDAKAWKENQKWWSDFWNRSHLVINSGRGEEDAGWRIGRNYELFRYMLASNVSGREPTLFNGGLFTFDPLYVNGKLVIYPANSLEGHWDARNPTSVIAGLRRVLGELILLPEKYTSTAKRKRWQTILDRLPDMPTGNNEKFGGRYLKPAENYEHHSWHCPEMFPLFPYELHGIGQGDLELMKHTSLATGADRYKTIAWEQANIHAAKLGDVELASTLNSKKLATTIQLKMDCSVTGARQWRRQEQ